MNLSDIYSHKSEPLSFISNYFCYPVFHFYRIFNCIFTIKKTHPSINDVANCFKPKKYSFYWRKKKKHEVCYLSATLKTFRMGNDGTYPRRCDGLVRKQHTFVWWHFDSIVIFWHLYNTDRFYWLRTFSTCTTIFLYSFV